MICGMYVQQDAKQTCLWAGMEPPTTHMRRVVLERLWGNGGD